MNTRRYVITIAVVLAGALSACAAQATPPRAVQTQVAAAPTSAPAGTEAPSVPGGQPGALPPAQQMIIKNADMQLLVDDTGQALNRVTQLALAEGGYVLSTQTSYEGDLQHASVEMAVPAAQFEAALTQLRSFGIKVLRENTTGQDVSAEYTDLQSRLNNLEATAARVRAFLDDSKTVEDSLAVNNQLSELEGQIEQIKGQMKYYEGRAAFSTITVTLTPQAPVELPQADPAWNPLRTLSRAVAALGQLLRFGTDITIWFLVLTSPLTIVLVGLLIVRYLFIRLHGPATRR